jgi:hypothetical protein
VDSITKSQNRKKGGNVRILIETQKRSKIEGRGYRAQNTNANMVKVLIDNVILGIKIDA